MEFDTDNIDPEAIQSKSYGIKKSQKTYNRDEHIIPGDSGTYEVFNYITRQRETRIGVKLKSGGISGVGSRSVKNKADSVKYDIK